MTRLRAPSPMWLPATFAPIGEPETFPAFRRRLADGSFLYLWLDPMDANDSTAFGIAWRTAEDRYLKSRQALSFEEALQTGAGWMADIAARLRLAKALGTGAATLIAEIEESASNLNGAVRTLNSDDQVCHWYPSVNHVLGRRTQVVLRPQLRLELDGTPLPQPLGALSFDALRIDEANRCLARLNSALATWYTRFKGRLAARGLSAFVRSDDDDVPELHVQIQAVLL